LYQDLKAYQEKPDPEAKPTVLKRVKE